MGEFRDELATRPPRIGLLSGHHSTWQYLSTASFLFGENGVTHVRYESQSWRVDGSAGVVRWPDRQNHAFAP